MSKALLQKLDQWKLDAKMEDSERFFYHTEVVEAPHWKNVFCLRTKRYWKDSHR